MIQKINPSDGDFLKYIPDAMLTPEQITSKMAALEKESAKINGMRREYQEEHEQRRQAALNAVETPALTMNPSARTNTSSAPTPPADMGVSQFAGQTGQNTNVLSDKAKADLAAFPFYKKTSKKANLDKAVSDPKLAKGYLDKAGDHMPLVLYRKRLDGTVCVVEAVGDNKWSRIWLILYAKK